MLRADKIMDYISDPLRKCLRDDNPYVRKTAALCVAKLYDMKPDLATENGFITMLQDMLGDSNPMASHRDCFSQRSTDRGISLGRRERGHGVGRGRGRQRRGDRRKGRDIQARLGLARQAACRVGRMHRVGSDSNPHGYCEVPRER